MAHPPALARALDLSPHPEGGWYRRIYASGVELPHPSGSGTRSSATLIHYLLAPGERSQWHSVASDEIWLWHQGGPLRLQTSAPGPAPSSLTDHLLGPDLDRGEQFHVTIPAGHWQRAEPAADHEVLVSCMVSPGFDFADFTLLQSP
ncbi:cupin domain-containing protein [Streptomyces sp. NBC_01476]|uniref:cupin domain-containing protein n=1 Tax=Streptomyces sp. NBC_01476 TaxID=2903881 RepID=UPI002E36D8A4|nr:cupin domain-containing protein [Streptomyces sp. NBC_01476]